MKLLLYLMLLSPVAGYAQVSLSGRVSDKNNLPVSYANIILKQDSLFISQTITDSLGNYHLKVSKNGYYDLFFHDINFRREKVSLNITKDTIVNVRLEELLNVLNEVIINSKRKTVERKPDRYVMNVTNSIVGAGTDAFVLLGKTPGIRASSKQISLVGKNDLIVTVDDKVVQLNGEDLISFLKTIPSGDIAKIEVITNPPAKYEAQGSSGVVNIVMKKNAQEGYSATVNTGYKQHKYSGFNENISLSLNKRKWSVHANFAAVRGTDFEKHAIDTYYPVQSWYLNGESIDKNASINSNLDVQYRLSDQTQINFSFLNTSRKSDKNTNYITNIFSLNNQLDSISTSTSDLDRKNIQSSIGLQLKHNFSPEGKSLTVEAEWLGRGEDKNQYLSGQNYLNPGSAHPISIAKIKSTNRSDLAVFTLNSEFKLPLNKYELSLGTKATFINLGTDSKIFEEVDQQYVFDKLQSPASTYKENRQALFSDLKKSFDKWKFQLGVRVEYTQTNGVSETTSQNFFRKNYIQFFPSLNAGYILNENSSFDLTYGRRINRPGFKLLDPFRSYTNAYDYWEGNPFLRPSLTNNLDISYTFHNSFTTTFSYSDTKDNFEQIAVFQPNNVIAHQALNYMNSSIYQLMLTHSLHPMKWIETNLQLQGYYKQYLTEITAIEDNKITGWYFSLSNQLQLNSAKTISAEMNFWYQSRSVDLESTYERQYNLDLGLRILLLQKNVSIGLNVSDALQSRAEKFSTKVNSISQNFYNYWEPGSFRVSLQYKFGNKKIKYSERQTSNLDERKR